MTCCAYSCTQYSLHTQYILLTHADDLLCLQLHTVRSPYTETNSLFLMRNSRCFLCELYERHKCAFLKYESKGGVFAGLLAVERKTSMPNSEIWCYPLCCSQPSDKEMCLQQFSQYYLDNSIGCSCQFTPEMCLWQIFLWTMAVGTTRRQVRGCGQWDPSGDGVTLSWSDVSVYTAVKENQGFFKRTKQTYRRIINNGKKAAVNHT